ncbi:hypothetical protein PAXRUDRAFT_836427 [Paxillus rubicundulus Ve08.2h10]|uniref:Uncharacterized protein n=1 Tax=Paxillus rubicundulus Ve08.2h10 TaxID=930991 RepID=A0A0D0BLL9_9AGAM|nr:hypothetical protein PAXRUDRAFT_836427 [Paxillus rubicundulus Ve08.2h10]
MTTGHTTLIFPMVRCQDPSADLADINGPRGSRTLQTFPVLPPSTPPWALAALDMLMSLIHPTSRTTCMTT